MNTTIQVLIILLSLLLAGLIAALRAALATLDKAEIQHRADAGDERARAVSGLLDFPLRMNLPLSILHWFAMLSYAAFGLVNVPSVADTFNSVLNLFVWLLALEGVASVLGITFANWLALTFARPLALIVMLTSPINTLGGWVARNLVPRKKRVDEKISGEEIQVTVMGGDEPRVIEELAPAEKQMIAGVIELKDTAVSEIMVPRIDVAALDVNTALDAAVDLVIKHGHSRLPVYEENIDHIIGLVYTKDLVQILRADKPGVSLRELLRPTYFTPESVRVADLFQELQKRRLHMAVVVDEYGGTAGIVTLEDVIEEIVGEIRDEYDAGEEAPITRVSDSEALFSSRVTIDEVNETLGLNLTDEENDSIGGLIYHRLGKMPKAGDTIEMNNARLVVTDIAGRRIRHVRVVKQTSSENASPENIDEASTVSEKD